MLEWFERDATTLKPEDGLHKLSGWGYLNTTQYQEIVRAAAARLDPPLRDGDSVFELGCGVGGVLSVLAQQLDPRAAARRLRLQRRRHPPRARRSSRTASLWWAT